MNQQQQRNYRKNFFHIIKDYTQRNKLHQQRQQRNEQKKKEEELFFKKLSSLKSLQETITNKVIKTQLEDDEVLLEGDSPFNIIDVSESDSVSEGNE